jgi:LacI family transcriptional regulator
VHSGFDAQSGHLVATRLMTEAARSTAIFAVNDITAIGATGALRDLGIRVGHDVAVVGFNDISIAAHLPTPLTSVRSPLKQMSRDAAALLLGILEHEHARPVRSPTERRLNPQLIVWGSSDVSVDSRSLRVERACVGCWGMMTGGPEPAGG